MLFQVSSQELVFDWVREHAFLNGEWNRQWIFLFLGAWKRSWNSKTSVEETFESRSTAFSVFLSSLCCCFAAVCMRIRASPSCLVLSLDRTRSTNTYLQTKNERQLRPSVMSEKSAKTQSRHSRHNQVSEMTMMPSSSLKQHCPAHLWCKCKGTPHLVAKGSSIDDDSVELKRNTNAVVGGRSHDEHVLWSQALRDQHART